ncbi:hypothetical protein RJ641_016963 [Dillenia turbinata]|uniref:Uncharacterized protein n=1 Tax=Dillenia turbinata TaxID=194707 RepID=A0AAN8YZ58_9MAGN
MQGTLGILELAQTLWSVNNSSSGKRVFMTGDKNLDMVDENVWVDVDNTSVQDINREGSLDFAEENGLDLVTLIPYLVVGPYISSQLPGNKESTSMVHTDDLASAHIFLLEYPNAKGHYICSYNEASVNQMAELLWAKYPQYQITNAGQLSQL